MFCQGPSKLLRQLCLGSFLNKGNEKINIIIRNGRMWGLTGLVVCYVPYLRCSNGQPCRIWFDFFDPDWTGGNAHFKGRSIRSCSHSIRSRDRISVTDVTLVNSCIFGFKILNPRIDRTMFKGRWYMPVTQCSKRMHKRDVTTWLLSPLLSCILPNKIKRVFFQWTAIIKWIPECVIGTSDRLEWNPFASFQRSLLK